MFLNGSNQERKIVIMIMRRDFRFHLVVNDYYLSYEFMPFAKDTNRWEQKITLPSPCTAFSQTFSVNSIRWRIRGERAIRNELAARYNGA